MYNGDSFGYLLKKPVSGGPYKYFDDPQYFGTTLCLLGYAIKHQSRIGYGKNSDRIIGGKLILL